MKYGHRDTTMSSGTFRRRIFSSVYSIVKTIRTGLRHPGQKSARARRLVRKMRGGAQSHLIEATDGEFYVLKSTNNPQHRRILINEWLCSMFLRHLGILAPKAMLIEITPEFVADHPDFYLSIGSRRELIPPGLHFGSHVAVNPDQTAIFDFLPDKMLAKVENRRDFLGVFVFDKWVGQVDSRQAIFFRARLPKHAGLTRNQSVGRPMWAQMIDHGAAFNEGLWRFQDFPFQGPYFQPSVYADVTSIDSFAPWLESIHNFPTEVIEAAHKQIPTAWIEGDQDELELMLEHLLRRRSRVPALIHDTQRNRPGTFANWRPVFAYQFSDSGNP